jgi:hypothetical protein
MDLFEYKMVTEAVGLAFFVTDEVSTHECAQSEKKSVYNFKSALEKRTKVR